MVVFALFLMENATPKRWKTFFRQQILLAEDVLKGTAPYKFGPVYQYRLSLVPKHHIMKIYKEVVHDFIRFLQIYLCLYAFLLFLFFNIL